MWKRRPAKRGPIRLDDLGDGSLIRIIELHNHPNQFLLLNRKFNRNLTVNVDLWKRLGFRNYLDFNKNQEIKRKREFGKLKRLKQINFNLIKFGIDEIISNLSKFIKIQDSIIFEISFINHKFSNFQNFHFRIISSKFCLRDSRSLRILSQHRLVSQGTTCRVYSGGMLTVTWDHDCSFAYMFLAVAENEIIQTVTQSVYRVITPDEQIRTHIRLIQIVCGAAVEIFDEIFTHYTKNSELISKQNQTAYRLMHGWDQFIIRRQAWGGSIPVVLVRITLSDYSGAIVGESCELVDVHANDSSERIDTHSSVSLFSTCQPFMYTLTVSRIGDHEFCGSIIVQANDIV
jgi:hypothetical protein